MSAGRVGRIAAFGVLALLFTFSERIAAAVEPAEQLAPSLQFIPATASSYSAMLHFRETVDAVAQSKAWKKLTELPLLQKGLTALSEQTEVEELLDKVKVFLADPQNQELVAMLGDMCGDEVFTYTDEKGSDLVSILLQVQGQANAFDPNLLMAFAGGPPPANPQAMSMRNVLDVLDRNRDKLHVPHFVVGFKVKDKPRAERQLKRMSEILAMIAGMTNELQGRAETKKVGDSTFMTLNLDGGMIPWDQVPFADIEETPGQYDKLQAKLKELKLVVAIGMRGDYVLISLSESLDSLAKFGQGPKLVERLEFKLITPHAQQHVKSLEYVSQELHTAIERGGDQLTYYKEKLTKLLETAGLPEEVQKRVKKDLSELAGDLEKLTPRVGALLSLSFSKTGGTEGFIYDFSENAGNDGTKPLSLLDHVGDQPLAFHVSRSKPSLARYDLLVKWGKILNKYVEDFAVPALPNDAKLAYDKFMKQFNPLMKRIDATTRTKLFPALADGQFAFVLDAKIFSKQWVEALPSTTELLPMFEPALIWGVSDAELLKQAAGEYRDALNDFFSSFNLLENPIALFRISEPEVKDLEAGTMYYYDLPEEAGIDKAIKPNAGLSKTVAVLSLSPRQTKSILGTTSLAATGVMARAKQPLASASFFNWAGTLDALRPWLDLGIRSLAEQPEFMNLFGVMADEKAAPILAPDDSPEVKSVLEQMHTLLDVLKCLKTYSSVTYQEDGVWTTHFEMVIEDLK